jgi:hypothetical protein
MSEQKKERKVISALIVHCDYANKDAVVTVYDDGYKEVKCTAHCQYCAYGKLVK